MADGHFQFLLTVLNYIFIVSSKYMIFLFFSFFFQVKIVENIALGYLDNLNTFGTLTGKGQYSITWF